MKKILVFLCLLVIGGCSYYKDTKVTITKEQQDNIAMRIFKYYDIKKIQFLKFTQDKKTGTLFLFIQIDDNPNLQTGLALDNQDSLNKREDWIGLNPIDTFKHYERNQPLVNFDSKLIKIQYIGE